MIVVVLPLSFCHVTTEPNTELNSRETPPPKTKMICRVDLFNWHYSKTTSDDRKPTAQMRMLFTQPYTRGQ